MAEPRRDAEQQTQNLKGARILIVEARFYNDIADALLEGATAVLASAGTEYDQVTVPGSLEIPSAIAIAVDGAERRGRPYEGVVALGCVIRGETIHFEIVSMTSAQAIMDLSVKRVLPIGNGIITVNTEEQAWARARRTDLDKGGDAARATLAMVRLKRRMRLG